jgi:hypothetical protein
MIAYDEAPEFQLLRRWQAGSFEDTDSKLSARWRQNTTTKNMKELKRRYQTEHSSALVLTDMDRVRARVDQFFSDPFQQPLLLTRLLKLLGAPEGVAKVVWARWNADPPDSMREFAPYASFVLRAQLTFELALANSLIKERPSTEVDLQYLFYLPFCHAFLSGDDDQVKLAEALRRDDQTIVTLENVKRDLDLLVAWREGLSPSQAEEYRRHYFHYPPDDPRTFLNPLWERHMRPRTPNSGNVAPDHTPEERRRLVEFLRTRSQAADDAFRRRRGGGQT